MKTTNDVLILGKAAARILEKDASLHNFIERYCEPSEAAELAFHSGASLHAADRPPPSPSITDE